MGSEEEKLTPYHWKRFGSLSVATFFEGYDHIALSQRLPNLREAFGGGPSVAVTAIGSVAAAGSILLWLPETSAKNLEQTARLDAEPSGAPKEH